MLESKKDYKAWLYLGIPLLLLTVFTFYPLLKTLSISFLSDYRPLTDSASVFNFKAYKALFGDPFFKDALINTLLLVFISVPLSTGIALLIAVALNSIKPVQKVFQTIFFLPYVTNVLAIGLVFSVMFSHPLVSGLKAEGLINTILGKEINWIGNGAPRRNWMFVVILYSIWNALPFKIMVFMGGLQSISKQYYDAAKIDSTPKNRVLRKITIPLLSPMISYIVITSLIGSFKAYESVIAVAQTPGQPLLPERFTLVGLIYEDALKKYGLDASGISYYSRGAASAIVLFLIIFAFTMFNLYISKKRVHY